MFITYDGKPPWDMVKHKAAAEETLTDLKKRGRIVEKDADSVLMVETAATE